MGCLSESRPHRIAVSSIFKNLFLPSVRKSESKAWVIPKIDLVGKESQSLQKSALAGALQTSVDLAGPASGADGRGKVCKSASLQHSLPTGFGTGSGMTHVFDHFVM